MSEWMYYIVDKVLLFSRHLLNTFLRTWSRFSLTACSTKCVCTCHFVTLPLNLAQSTLCSTFLFWTLLIYVLQTLMEQSDMLSSSFPLLIVISNNIYKGSCNCFLKWYSKQRYSWQHVLILLSLPFRVENIKQVINNS